MNRDKAGLRRGIEQRLEFIEFRLFWDGDVNRIDVMRQCGVSVNQASSDLNRYIALAPGNMGHDKSARTDVCGSDFDCRFRPPDAAHYLSQLCVVADDLLESEDCRIPDPPPYASAPTPVRGVDPVKLRSVAGAIRRSEALRARYQSPSGPEPQWRWIAPHAIAFDGLRWRTWALCLTADCFQDFLLSQVLEIRGSRETEASPDDDRDWHSAVALQIALHPELPEAQAKVISLNYGMRSGKAKIKVRRVLSFCALRRLALDADPTARGSQDQRIVLLNRELFDADHG